MEWRAVQDIVKKRLNENLMLIRFDGTDITGLFSTDGYIDATGRRSEVGTGTVWMWDIGTGPRAAGEILRCLDLW